MYSWLNHIPERYHFDMLQKSCCKIEWSPLCGFEICCGKANQMQKIFLFFLSRKVIIFIHVVEKLINCYLAKIKKYIIFPIEK